jgi:hypothetical protein
MKKKAGLIHRSVKISNFEPYVHFPSKLSHSFLTHVSQLYSQLTPYVPEVHSVKKMLKFREIGTLISTNILHPKIIMPSQYSTLRNTQLSISSITNNYHILPIGRYYVWETRIYNYQLMAHTACTV